MDEESLFLRWNNHSRTFLHVLGNLRKDEIFSDATLACDGKFYPVHKIVLSSCSDYFSEIFKNTSCTSPVIILTGIQYEELEVLLDYMYIGEVSIKETNITSFISAAKSLQIKGLIMSDDIASFCNVSGDVKDSLSNSVKIQECKLDNPSVNTNNFHNSKESDLQVTTGETCNMSTNSDSLVKEEPLFSENISNTIEDSDYKDLVKKINAELENAIAGPSGIQDDPSWTFSHSAFPMYEGDISQSNQVKQESSTSEDLKGFRNIVDTKLYKCSQCDYSSADASNLRRHRQTHSRVKPYDCKICGYKGARKSHLQTHMLKHKGEKPFHCHLCPFKATLAHGLRSHLKTHTSERPFECNLCPYKAKRSDHLKHHVQVVHKPQNTETPVDGINPKKINSPNNILKSDKGNVS